MVKTTMKTPQQLLDETCAIQYVDNDVLATAPRSSEKSKVELFTVGKYITDEELEKEYEKRGLVPATLDELVSMYGTKEYIATHWKNADGTWCYIAFDRWDDERGVYVNRRGRGWDDYWWFAGVRKSSELKSSELSDTLFLDAAIQKVKDAGYVIYKKI